MSQDNMAAVRAVYDEWAKGNFGAGGELWDSRVVFVPIVDLPDAGDYFGLEGITTFMRGFLQPWTNFTITADELIEAGDSVVVVARQRGIGRDSGLLAELEQQFQVWTFRGRTVIRFEAFRERAEALEAVGLRE
jgi:ketosteroid isomerase-like protein